MKRIVESEENELVDLLGQKVLIMCANYFYYGKLSGVNSERVELEEPHIVYETGAWANKKFSDAQRLPADRVYVRLAFVESYQAIPW